MNKPSLILSNKYKAFLHCKASFEFLEGTTYAGKTTVGVYKFMLKVFHSKQKQHIISGLDLGTIEKNIINKDLGIVDIFGDLVRYNPAGLGTNALPHITVKTSKGTKVIYILGYDNKSRWKKALGGQYGCVYIDEINIADMEYIREIAMRCNYLIATLNPDNPSLPIYEEYINHSRPLAKWKNETPPEILEMLDKEPKENWVHWFFSFKDNESLTLNKLNKIKENTPKGTKQYKNKIEGLRGKSVGLIFDLQPMNIITTEQAKKHHFETFTVGVDTSYSEQSQDDTVITFGGITTRGIYIALSSTKYNNKELSKPLTPSDMPELITAIADIQRNKWGFARDIFIDSADAATILECQKYAKRTGSIYNFVKAWKKTKIIDRIQLQRGWLATGHFLILDTCKPLIDELNRYSWQENKPEPEDRNDHAINSCQYSWLPFKNKIGER